MLLAEDEFAAFWRVILRYDNGMDARAALGGVEEQLGVEFVMTVFEPFSEAPGLFDCCFWSKFRRRKGEQLEKTIQNLISRLPGEWQIEDRPVSESGVIEVQAFVNAYDDLDARWAWGHFWVRDTPEWGNEIFR